MRSNDVIYLDHNASTPVLPRVRDAMMRALDEGFGNPSATHAFGTSARRIVERAREQVAALIGASPREIVFTSGGTEANNLAIRGMARAASGLASVTSSIEHPATLEPARCVAESGAPLRLVEPTSDGVIPASEVARSLPDRGPCLVSVIAAQNETGVLQPIGEIAEVARDRGAWVHVDAAQAVGKVPVDVRALGVSLLSIAGHKLYAPKGVGALFVAEGVPLEPVLVGAGHERGIRPGTENVAAIAALGEACALALEDLEHEAARQRTLRDALVEGLAASGFIVHGARAERLPNTVNGRFPGVLGAALQEAATALAFSTASACHAGQASPSKVLLAMGLTPTEALGAVRLSLGRATTFHDVRDAAASLRTAAEALSSARNSHATVDR
jgi:cysteine desulfurase